MSSHEKTLLEEGTRNTTSLRAYDTPHTHKPRGYGFFPHPLSFWAEMISHAYVALKWGG